MAFRRKPAGTAGIDTTSPIWYNSGPSVEGEVCHE
jgi:hypothetical protein